MTARRAARRPSVEQVDDGLTVWPELLEADHVVWHDQAAYLVFCASHDLTPCEADRFGGPGAHPATRRSEAAGDWAEENWVTAGSHADWHRLRAMSLID